MNLSYSRLYYSEPNLLQHTAKVVAIEGNLIHLDTTIFHPQGGGQPSHLSDALQAIIAHDVKVISTIDDGVRKISFGSYHPTACGGTHVQSLSEIGTILIRNVKSKSGRIRVGYDVA